MAVAGVATVDDVLAVALVGAVVPVLVVLVLVLPLRVLRVFEAFLVDPRSVLDLVLFIVALPRPDLEDSIRGFRDCQMKSGRASVPRRGPPLNAP